MLTSADVKRQASALGFSLCGIAAAQAWPELQALPGWLARGFAGRMTYLNRTARKRADARHWLPSARSIVCVACLYHTDRPLSVEVSDPEEARIARYSWGDDYHVVLQARLEALLAWMREAAGVPFDARLGVDDAPVQERVYAARAGLGWIGKNTCVINPEIGSWLVLGEIAISLDLEPDAPVFDQCGTCQLCLDACPTQAIVEPFVVDARRCLSYLTIEVRKSIPEGQRPDLGAHVFGCDICQDVCPHNSNVAPSTDPVWRPRTGLDRASLAGLWTRSDSALEALIDGTALSRRGVSGVRRNLAVALGNSGNPAFSNVLSAKAAGGETAEDPIVAEHVSWAVRRLTRPPET